MTAFDNNPTAIAFNEFRFLGLSALTNNQNEMTGEAVIPSMWSEFYEKRISESIPNKKNASIIALYTQYESDETGTYTFAVGAEVSQSEPTPDGLDAFEIPASNYVVFTTRKGPVQEVVVETWQKIWEWSKHNARAFETDFEVYDERAADPSNSQVDIYISVK